MSEEWQAAAAALVGAVIGSFLNVCVHRLPRKQSIVWPSSHCPHCDTSIRWYDNIPLVSYLWLGARCRSCGSGISWRYPVVELLNAAGYGLVVWRFGVSPLAGIYLMLWSALLVVSFIDLEHMIVPDRITLPGMALGLAAGPFLLPQWWDSMAGLLVGGGLLYFMAWISPYLFGKEGMGGGDIKLLAMIGAFLGWKPALLTVLLGGLLGAVIGLLLIAARRLSRGAYLPFGPFLSLGAAVVMLFGQEILDWYGAFLRGAP